MAYNESGPGGAGNTTRSLTATPLNKTGGDGAVTHRIEWKCAACGFPIDDYAGAIVAPHEQINEPDGAIYWTPWHYQCQPTDGYGIEASGLRNADDVIQWTRHLFSKGWFRRSEWEAVCDAATSRPGRVG